MDLRIMVKDTDGTKAAVYSEFKIDSSYRFGKKICFDYRKVLLDTIEKNLQLGYQIC